MSHMSMKDATGAFILDPPTSGPNDLGEALVCAIPYQATKYPWLYDTDTYLVSTVGVQVGEATDETLSFLLRHYTQDRDLIRACVQEQNRRRRLEGE